LALSPLTNTMPILRHNLHRGGGPIDFLMAWVSVPDLTVHPSAQRYTFIRALGDRRIVRYEGRHRDYVGDIEVDDHGFVVHYPELATRVAAV
ncbi:MAG TPA: putative glycolipid-binding domain-containing protein, partial [Actinomycetota bacterium]